MFDWRSKLIPAKFKGAKFQVVSSTRGVGRRNVIHEYPFQEIPYAEDLGKAAGSYKIDGYIIQKPPFYNYFKDRDALIKALESEGPGQLDHPYYGKKQVVLDGEASIVETFQEGGIARFSMTFVEAGERQNPDIKTNKFGVDQSAWDAINAAIDTVAEKWDAAQSVVDDINSGMQQIQGAVLAIRSLPSTATSRAIQLVSQATSLVAVTLSTPCALAQAVASGFDGIQYAAGMLTETFERGISKGCAASSGSNARDRETTSDDENRSTDTISSEEVISLIKAALKMANYGSSQGSSNGNVQAIVVTSENSAVKKANQQMMINLIRTNALANAAMVAARGIYDSYEDAMRAMTLISNAIDDFVEYLGDEAGDDTLSNQGVSFTNDNVYSTIKAMKPVFIRTMKALGATLTTVKSYDVPPDTMSTILLAYNEYGDINRAEEIRKRNKSTITHPGFIPGGETISILAR